MTKKVQIISPSDDIVRIPRQITEQTKEKFEHRTNLEVKYSKNLFEKFDVDKTLEDIYDAYLDNDVSLVMCYKGGWYAKELLDKLDYNIIAEHKKPMIGYSDNTILLNAIYLKLGQKNYYGPTFSAFNMDKGFDFTNQNFNEVARDNNKFKINVSKFYSYDRKWYEDQEKRNFIENDDSQVIRSGEATGVVLGGHLSSFDYLLSRDFKIKDKDIILILEENGKDSDYLTKFQKKVKSVIEKVGKEKIKAILLGRSEIPISKDTWEKVLEPFDLHIPVMCNLDFGHTSPTLSIPIGEKITIKV